MRRDQLLDSPARYGLVSRVLHWGMAALFAWQFAGMGLRLLLGRHPVSAFFVGTHAGVGTLLFVLVLLRGAWGLLNARRRPSHRAGWLGWAARLGHMLIYALMLVVPGLALLRQWGSGRAFAPFGLPLWGARESTAPALVQAGNAAHGELAWLLLAVVAGHVAMVILHRRLLRHDVLPRMAGPLRPAEAPPA
ncbi:cytochrome b561 [Roseomonas rosea]|uniref:Cytochrome b561 n=1 Tax=Muricoccus roseus TaxID=198092 RepID=A0A1M6E4A0_9PROT|nr:cytochrome b [Roseomonas rosea]SHI80078.1 cytochrome b561 [Roseomonas rosea]